jgi:hypothetical protein
VLAVAVTGPRGATRLLGLTSRPAYLVLAVFTASNTLNAVATLGDVRSPAAALVGLVLVTVGAVLVLRPAPDPYPLPLTFAVLGLTTAVSLLAWNLPAQGWPGWASWFWSAVTVLLFVVALRGRTAWAWLGFAMHAGITAGWAFWTGRGLGEAAGFVLRHAGLLLVVTLFTVLLRRTLAQIRRMQEAGVVRIRAEESAAAALRVQRERRERLLALTGDTLERLASGGSLTAAEKREALATEAAVRDWLRGGALATEEVLQAAQRARARGVKVALLDDGEARPHPPDTITAVVRALDDARAGHIVVRALPPGRETSVTIRAHHGERLTRIDL